MRLFCSLRPSAAAVDHLDAALAPLRDHAGLTLRWGDPSQWHLTLAFSPAVPDGALGDVVAAVTEAARATEPLELALAGAGEFGGRTLWIGVGGQTGPLERLMAEPMLGEPVRERHRAHLTVARVSARAPQVRRRRGTRRERSADPVAALLGQTVHALSIYRGPTWRAEEIEVVASHLGQGRSGGPRHEVLARVPLDPGV